MDDRHPAPVEPPPATPATLRVRVLLFASLADLLGARRRDLHLSAPATVADAVRRLAEDAPDLAARAGHISYAVNEEFAPSDALLADGDELALIPPVSGG